MHYYTYHYTQAHSVIKQYVCDRTLCTQPLGRLKLVDMSRITTQGIMYFYLFITVECH